MTPVAALDQEKMQQEVNKELDKAKDALTNLTLMYIAEWQGSPLPLQDNLLAARIEAYWANAVRAALPIAARDNS